MAGISAMKGIFMEILTYGAGERLRVASSELSALCGESRIIILPIPTTRDKRHVFGTQIPLSEVVEACRGGAMVAGYGIPENIKREIIECGGSVYDGEEDEELLSGNAALTALGALGWILTKLPSSPDEITFGIVGYGRIGSRLARMLLFFGAKVRVYSGNSATLRELSELGVEAYDYRCAASFDGVDVLINTAPASIVTKDRAKGVGRIVELASGGYLEDIPEVIKLASLPEVSFPISAGVLYAERIRKFFGLGLTKGDKQ